MPRAADSPVVGQAPPRDVPLVASLPTEQMEELEIKVTPVGTSPHSPALSHTELLMHTTHEPYGENSLSKEA